MVLRFYSRGDDRFNLRRTLRRFTKRAKDVEDKRDVGQRREVSISPIEEVVMKYVRLKLTLRLEELSRGLDEALKEKEKLEEEAFSFTLEEALRKMREGGFDEDERVMEMLKQLDSQIRMIRKEMGRIKEILENQENLRRKDFEEILRIVNDVTDESLWRDVMKLEERTLVRIIDLWISSVQKYMKNERLRKSFLEDAGIVRGVLEGDYGFLNRAKSEGFPLIFMLPVSLSVIFRDYENPYDLINKLSEISHNSRRFLVLLNYFALLSLAHKAARRNIKLITSHEWNIHIAKNEEKLTGLDEGLLLISPFLVLYKRPLRNLHDGLKLLGGLMNYFYKKSEDDINARLLYLFSIYVRRVVKQNLELKK